MNYIIGVSISLPLITVHIYSYCHPIPSLIHTFSVKYEAFTIHCDDIFIHTNTYPVLSAVLLQLFTPRNHLPLCGCKHFASAMETRCVWQSTVHQHLHCNEHQHCFFSYDILLHIKIISTWFL